MEQKGDTNLIYTQWNDNRDIAVLSTNCTPLVHRRGRCVISEVVKPNVVTMYNENMGGVDQSDF